MLCPFCSTALQVVNRQGVEIDWCPGCKGVWLERGELEKLIDRAAADTVATGATRNRRHDDDDDDDDDDRWRDRESHGGNLKRKRRGFLSEIFDF